MAGIPKILENIVIFLRNQSFQLYENPLLDDRVNSAHHKLTILGILHHFFFTNNIHPYYNHWFDFSFLDERNIPYPVRIKIIKMNTADNLNCKLGIYYTLTGQFPPFDNNVEWEQYFWNLKQGIKENDRDYYFLIINKYDPKDIFATSLKQLHSIMPNGDNPPFQAKWDDNRVLIQRTFDEAKDFILSTFEESLRLRTKAYSYFKQNF